MSVLSRDDFLGRVRGRLGEDLSDDDITLIEDMSDTYDDMYNKINDNTDWKSKYDELDKSWRQKYVDRFNGKVDSDSELGIENTGFETEKENDYESPKTYEELFSMN